MSKEQKRFHAWTQLEPDISVDGMNTQMCPSAARRKPPHLLSYEKIHLRGHGKKKKQAPFVYIEWNRFFSSKP